MIDHPIADPERDAMFQRDDADSYRREHPGAYVHVDTTPIDQRPRVDTPQDQWMRCALEAKRLADDEPMTALMDIAARRFYLEVRDALRGTVPT